MKRYWQKMGHSKDTGAGSRNTIKTGHCEITKKFSQQVGGECTWANQHPDAKEAK